MRIPGKIFSLRLGSHYAVEATICKKSTANLTIQGEVFLEKEPLPGYYSKNRVASAQFLTCVTIARPAAAASIFRHSFLTPREKLRLEDMHHQALAVRGDLSAPTCTTCHGNHGAAPPGVDKVENVCSNCHTFQAQMYEKSSHKKAFEAASLPGCVVCHSNHGISHPTDAMLGSGPEGVCMRCHTPGDACDRARAGFQSSLGRLDEAIKSTDRVLGVAESSGMEVSEARLGQDQARDSLTKARVTIHSFRTDLVDQDIQAGLKIAGQNLQAGQRAMVERNHRRVGLGMSLIAIGIALVGLWLYIKKIEN